MTVTATPSPGEAPLNCSEIHPIPSRSEQAKKVTPFDQWSPPSITIPRPPTDIEYTDDNVRNGLNGWADDVAELARDSYGNPLVELGVDHSTEHQEAKRRERQRRRNEKETKFNQVSLEDSWKLGVEGLTWTEKRTCSVNADPTRPPFQRLLDATLDFFYSRTRAFDDMETRSRFSALRYTLGLKRPHASWYTMTHHGRKYATAQQLQDYENGVIGEVCPLVRCPELAVRGYLAMLRRDTDAIWELDRAVASAEIFAALMGYFEFYDVITDEHLVPALKRAVKLAKAGPRLLREAFKLEEEVDKVTGFNRAGWALIGGSYLHRHVAGISEETPISQATHGTQNGDDGGWGVSTDDNAPQTEMTAEQAKGLLTSLVAPLAVDSVRLLNYIPFSRRIITAVIPPHQNNGPTFTTTYYRLRTAPAPWSPDEQWREPSPRRRAEAENALAEDDEADEGNAAETVTFELEQSTIDEPDEIDFWVDGKELGIDGDGSWLVGMGLRARWAQIRIDEESSWWIPRLKDYVLPSIWRMTPEEREISKRDPPAPYEEYGGGGTEENTQAKLEDGGEKEGENAAVETGSVPGDADRQTDGTTVADASSIHGNISFSAKEADTDQPSAHTIQDGCMSTSLKTPEPSPDEGNAMPSAQKADEDADLPGVIAVNAGEEDEIDFDDDFDDGFDDEKDIIAFFTQPQEAAQSDSGDEGTNDEDAPKASMDASGRGAIIEEIGATPPITGTATSAAHSSTAGSSTSAKATNEAPDVAAPKNVV